MPHATPWSHHTAARTDKTLTTVVRGWQVNVSADRVKPAYIFEGIQHDTSSPPAQPRSNPAKPVITTTRPPKTSRSGRTVRFPARFNT